MRTKLLYLLISTFAFLGLSACGDDEYPMRPGDGALIVSLSERPAVQSGGLVLYVFNSGGDVVLRNEYADHGALGSDFMSLPPGEYAVVVVGGVPSSMLPAILSPQELIDRLNDIQSACPGMMTAMDYATVEENSVSRLSVTLQDGLSGMSLVVVIRVLILTIMCPSAPAAWPCVACLRPTVTATPLIQRTGKYSARPNRTAHSWPNSP